MSDTAPMTMRFPIFPMLTPLCTRTFFCFCLVWGPMSMLTYWSLQAYDHVPEVRQGRKAMAKQVTAMMLNQWRLNRHICENYNPHKDGTDCTGDKFYHWGGLTGLTTLIETGHYARAQA